MEQPTDDHRDRQLDNKAEAKAVMEELMGLLVQLHKRMESDEEKPWLKAHCQNARLLSILEDMTPTMIHVLDTIGQFQPVNGSAISKHMEMPKGTVSKITRKLVHSALVVTEFLPDNRKEILFRLTPLGHELFEIHQILHQRIEAAIENLYRKYDVDELRFIVAFLKDGLESPWIEPDPNE